MTNICILSGRLGAEPEVTDLNNGGQKAAFSIAVENPYKDKNDEWHDCTEWHHVVTYNKSLIEQVLNAYNLKGRLVHVTGSYRARPYEKNGQKLTWHELEVKRFRDFAVIDTLSSGDSDDEEDV